MTGGPHHDMLSSAWDRTHGYSGDSLPRSLVIVKSNVKCCAVAARHCLVQPWLPHSQVLCSFCFLGEAEWSQSSRRGRGRTVGDTDNCTVVSGSPPPAAETARDWLAEMSYCRKESQEKRTGQLSQFACLFGNRFNETLICWREAQNCMGAWKDAGLWAWKTI